MHTAQLFSRYLSKEFEEIDYSEHQWKPQIEAIDLSMTLL